MRTTRHSRCYRWVHPSHPTLNRQSYAKSAFAVCRSDHRSLVGRRRRSGSIDVRNGHREGNKNLRDRKQEHSSAGLKPRLITKRAPHPSLPASYPHTSSRRIRSRCRTKPTTLSFRLMGLWASWFPKIRNSQTEDVSHGRMQPR